MILAHIPTLQGGAWNEFTVLKQNRITAIATENHLPLIALVQSVSNSFRYRDISMSSRHCVHTYVGFVPVNRLASSFPNSSAFSIRVARYFEISLFEQNMDYRVALWSLALLQREVLIIRLFQTTQYSYKIKRRSSWAGRLWSRWPPAKLLQQKTWVVRKCMRQSQDSRTSLLPTSAYSSVHIRRPLLNSM